MFSNDTPVQSRRKSFRAFTDQLIRNNQNQIQSNLNLDHHGQEEDSSQQNPNDDNGQELGPTNQPNELDTNNRLPSASLILGHKSKINPRLPRPSKLPIVQFSYAYGAAGPSPPTNSQSLHHYNSNIDQASVRSGRSSNSRSSSISRTRRSRRGSNLNPATNNREETMSIDSTSNVSDHNNSSSEPAHVRYARLAQRMQNTGSVSNQSSSKTHSTQSTINISKQSQLPIPNSKDTSVNIASAFERARWATNPNQQQHPQQPQRPQKPPSQNHNQQQHLSENQNLSTTDQTNDPHQAGRVPSREGPQQPLDPTSNQNELLAEANSSFESRKRRRSRRLLDPTYKYRPGDSASSDSEAGEGIADKRERRELKKRLEQAQAASQQGGQAQKRKQKRRRTSTQTQDSDDVTDSDLDTGPGIAATRPRRSLNSKSAQNNGLQEQPSKRRKDSNKRKKASHEDTDQSESNDEGDDDRIQVEHPEPSHPEALDNNGNESSNIESEPAATFFLAKPNSGQQQPQARLVGGAAEDSSRLTNFGFSTDSYDFAEEERIVQDLEVQTRNQRSLASETAHLNQREESSSSSALDRQSHWSDSGMREIEEIVASNRPSFHQPRVLPIQRPQKQIKIGPPITEEKEPDQREASLESVHRPRFGFGDRAGLWFNRLKSNFTIKKSRLIQLFWASAILAVVSALLMNSYRTGDLSMFGWPWYSNPRSGRPIYSAPKEEIQDIEQLVTRLKSLESTVSTISLDHAKDSNQMFKNIDRDRAHLDDKIERLEIRFELESNDNIKRMETKLRKEVSDGIKYVRKDIDGIKVGRKDDRTESEKLRLKIKDLSEQLESLSSQYQGFVSSNRGAGSTLSAEDVKRLIGESIDQDRLKKSLISQVLAQIKSDGSFLTKSEIASLLESELKAMGIGFENQLNTKVTKLKEDLAAQLSRASPSGLALNKKHVNKKIESPEEMISAVESMIDEAIEIYSNDRLSKRDFALYSGGGRVLPQLTSPTYEIRPKTITHKLIALLTGTDTVIRGRSPITAISPESDIGMCWPFEGSVGQIGIQLSRKIVVQEISIEHVSKHLAFELDSAPREIEIWSVDGNERLASGTYDPFSDQRIQTIKVENNRTKEVTEGDREGAAGGAESLEAEEEGGSGKYSPVFRNGIVVKFLSNHGNQFYSCIYRVRVHGLMESELDLNRNGSGQTNYQSFDQDGSSDDDSSQS